MRTANHEAESAPEYPGTDAGIPVPYSGELPRELARLFLKSCLAGAVIGGVVATLYFLILLGTQDFERLVVWLVAILGITALRLSLLSAHRRLLERPHALERWLWAHGITAAITGFMWGLAAIWFYPDSGQAETLFVQAFVIAAVPAGALSALAAIWPIYAVYTASGLVPFALVHLYQGDTANVVLGLAAFAYLALLLAVARAYQQVIVDSIRKQIEVRELAAQFARARDEAEKANRSKSQFLANMSHEIRTPMNAVLGLSELLIESNIDAAQRERASGIHNSARALLQLINDMLDVSRIEAGQMKLVASVFEPRAVAEHVRALLLPMANEKALALELDIDPKLPPAVRGDEGRIRQILVNLAVNAIKFTERGHVRIAVSAASAAQSDVVDLLVRVEDTGIGIAPEMLGQIFEPFVQADDSDTRRHGGTGLGLYIVRQLACVMGGEVTAQSVPGQGSVFEFRVALQRPRDSEAPRNARARATPLPGSVRPLNLLLVEDNETNQLVARSMLESGGHRVSVANDGAQALALFATAAFDGVLMDCQMPVMDGVEATRRMREHEAAAGTRTPIIALTANAMEGDRERYLASGMDAFLAKPFDRRGLLDTVARACAGESQPEQSPGTVPGAAQPAGAAAEPSFDSKALDDLAELDRQMPGLMKKLVTTLLETTPPLLARVTSGTDLADATIAAHSLKSTTARFGANRLSRLAASAESASREADASGLRELGPEIEEEYARFLREFRSHPAVAGSID